MSIKDLIQRMIDAVASGETVVDGVAIHQLISGCVPVGLYYASFSFYGFDLVVSIVFSKGDVVIQNDFNDLFVVSVIKLFGERCNVSYTFNTKTQYSNTGVNNLVAGGESRADVIRNKGWKDMCEISFSRGDFRSCVSGNDWRKVLSEVKAQASEVL